MNCPVCKRDLAPTLSICLTCGAMMNDTVREELQTKVVSSGVSGRLADRKLPPTVPYRPTTPVAAPTPTLISEAPPRRAEPNQPPAPRFLKDATPVSKDPVPVKKPEPVKETPPEKREPAPMRYETSELGNKKTSPTLVGFQSKNSAVPDWRLQLQNSIRQRTQKDVGIAEDGATFQKQLVTRGANALKVEFVDEPKTIDVKNPRVANALKRIEESRKAFLPEKHEPDAPSQPAAASRNYPFNVVSRAEGVPVAPETPPRATMNAVLKPRLVSSLRIEKKGFDTNKLPPLPGTTGTNSGKLEAAAAGPLSELNKRLDAEAEEQFLDGQSIIETEQELVEDEESNEYDDLAPMAMRFNAGLFDLIAGSFATLILLTPFMLGGGSWLTFSGFFAFAAALAIVMFIYLTASISFYGRSLGMRMFSLELIDADESEYPTVHQAAVNSAVYLLSLALAGVGFIPMLMNDERRAAHDLLSGTILIREN